MKRRSLFALLLVCAAAPTAAAKTDTPNAGAKETPAQIETRGSATITLVPDIATVTMAVVTRSEKAPAALDLNSADAVRLIAFCKSFGINQTDIRSGPVRVVPRFRTVNDGRGMVQQDDGYEATNTIRAKLTDMSKVGVFVRSALDNGASRLNGVEFALKDKDNATEKARAAAFADARRKAQHFASLANVRLDRLLRVSYPPRLLDAARFSDTVSLDEGAEPRINVPIEAGTIEVRADVDVIWSAK